jgi:hypothetical protein
MAPSIPQYLPAVDVRRMIEIVECKADEKATWRHCNPTLKESQKCPVPKA